MLEVRNILKRRKGFLIRADFIVRPGEFLALKGRSGSGKTTVLRAIAGLEQIDSGEIFRNGSAINHQPPEKRCFGLVLQNPSLFFHLDMVDNITFGLKARGIKRNQRIQTALSLLNRLGLLHLKDAQVENLSGGEQRRIALLRAICWSPQALLLDEPFTGLDALSKQKIKDELSSFVKELEIPCILISHDDSDLEGFSATVIEVNETQSGQVRTFLQRPSHLSA